MTAWRSAALAAVCVIGGALIATAVPVAHGQTRIVKTQNARALKIFGGGSRIGVSIRDLEDADLKSMKGVTTGVIVEDVTTDSPAQKAGMRTGDVVVEFDGERVRSAVQLTRLVQETPPGRGVPASVVREGQRSTLTVTPTDDPFNVDPNRYREFAMPVPPRPPAPPIPPAAVFRFDELMGRTGRLGVTLDSLSTQLAGYFGTKEGVLVTSVYDNSVAAKAGLKAGDVITSINGTAVNDPGDVRRRIQDARDGDAFTLEVMRERKPVTLKGTLERVDPPKRSVRTII